MYSKFPLSGDGIIDSGASVHVVNDLSLCNDPLVTDNLRTRVSHPAPVVLHQDQAQWA
jgi:hypothetical protein